MAKHLWAITKKQDMLWIKCIHAYYIKHSNPLTMDIPAILSWAFKKIMASRDVLLEQHTQHLLDTEHFFIMKLYMAIRGEQPTVYWRRIICNNKASPKALFITWLMPHNRLATKSRLCEWRVLIANTCVICLEASETISHLFFECPTSQ